MNKTAKWLMILLATSLVGAGLGQLIAQHTFQNSGSIATIGVTVTWMDGTAVTTVDWGAVENGTAYILDPMNVTNISNVNVNLTLSTTNLVNIIEGGLILDWNYTAGTVLAPNESVIVELTQTVTATGNWSYTTVIEAKSVE